MSKENAFLVVPNTSKGTRFKCAIVPFTKNENELKGVLESLGLSEGKELGHQTHEIKDLQKTLCESGIFTRLVRVPHESDVALLAEQEKVS
ncbi:MAG: hypothetical protein WD509_02870 [Candidatus Paceibacterota bacterium]